MSIHKQQIATLTDKKGRDVLNCYATVEQINQDYFIVKTECGRVAFKGTSFATWNYLDIANERNQRGEIVTAW